MNNKQAKRLRKLVHESASESALPGINKARYKELKENFKKIPPTERAKFLKSLDRAVEVVKETHEAHQQTLDASPIPVV